jgi:hypothetical protein
LALSDEMTSPAENIGPPLTPPSVQFSLLHVGCWVIFFAQLNDRQNHPDV